MGGVRWAQRSHGFAREEFARRGPKGRRDGPTGLGSDRSRVGAGRRRRGEGGFGRGATLSGRGRGPFQTTAQPAPPVRRPTAPPPPPPRPLESPSPRGLLLGEAPRVGARRPFRPWARGARTSRGRGPRCAGPGGGASLPRAPRAESEPVGEGRARGPNLDEGDPWARARDAPPDEEPKPSSPPSSQSWNHSVEVGVGAWTPVCFAVCLYLVLFLRVYLYLYFATNRLS